MGYYVNPSAESFAAIAKEQEWILSNIVNRYKSEKKNPRSINKD